MTKYKRQTHYVRTKFNEAPTEYCYKCGAELNDDNKSLAPTQRPICYQCFVEYSWMPCEKCGQWTFIDEEHAAH